MMKFIKKFNYVYIGERKRNINELEIFYDFDTDISEIYIHLWQKTYKQILKGISEKIFMKKIKLQNNKLYAVEELNKYTQPEAGITLIEKNKKEIIDLIGIIAKFLDLKEATIFFTYFDYNDKIELKEKNLLDKLLIYLTIDEIIIKFNYYITNIVGKFDFDKVIRLPDVYDNLEDFQEKIYQKEKINLEYFSKAFIQKYIL